MKKLIMFAIAVASISASASTTTKLHEGTTPNGEACAVRVDHDMVVFASNGDGFSFTSGAADIAASLREGHNPVVVRGGDNFASAQLSLYFDGKGQLSAANFKKKMWIMPTADVQCHHLRLK